MLIAYIEQLGIEKVEITQSNQELLREALWIDLLYPSKAEEMMVTKELNLELPTSYAIVKSGLFNHLYEENGVLFMTATMISQSESLEPKLDHVSFILTTKQLITIRYIEPLSFKLLDTQLHKLDLNHRNAIFLLVKLLDLAVNRIADLFQLLGHNLEEYSKNIFRNENKRKVDYQKVMQQLGMNGDLNSKVRESLVSLDRLIIFFLQIDKSQIKTNGRLQLITLNKNLTALGDHANFVSDKISFLSNAALGMINIEQNKIIKTFSVVAVIFMPPTLVASIYGMNFKYLPELEWKYGYLYGIFMMLIGSLLPYMYFKYKKWL